MDQHLFVDFFDIFDFHDFNDLYVDIYNLDDFELYVDNFYNLDLNFDHNRSLVMSSAFWDKTWSRPYERYNRHHKEIWEAVLPFIQGKVADIGCGPCYLHRGSRVNLTGVDFSEKALEQARINYPQGKYFLASADNTGLPDNTFDTVLLLGLIDWVDDRYVILKEAERICKPGGQIVATLLHGFREHDWSDHPKIIGNWHLLVIKK